jgi:hypothetical protein
VSDVGPPVHAGSAIARRLILAAACLGSLACWALIRIPTGRGIHGAMAMQCARLEMLSTDWPCRLGEGRVVAVYLLASLFVSLAVVVPSVLLAMRGRRVLAFVPMMIPAAIVLLDGLATLVWSGVWVHVEHTSVSPIFLGPWEPWALVTPIPGPWRPDQLVAIFVDLVVLALPIVVYQLLFRPARPARWTFGWRAALLACALAVGASLAAEWVAAIATRGLYIDGGWFFQGLILLGFGLLLPVGRSRPLWALPVVAILASLGPTSLLIGMLYRYTALSWFRTSIPLTLIGLAGATSVWLVARQRGFRPDPAESPMPRFRPIAIAYAASVGALAVSLVMSLLDPLPVEIATSLPSYLGARERVEDLRSRMTLDRAADLAVAFHERNGTFRGFDAATAHDLDGGLLWEDGLPGPEADFGPERTVRIATTSDDRIDLVLVAQPTTYCLRIRPQVPVTYGIADGGAPAIRARTALRGCAGTIWTDELLRPFPVDDLCVQAADITICRAVQGYMRKILASPTGEI